MQDAQPKHISFQLLIDRLKQGQYVIPDFQREFEWKPSDIRDLLHSIFLDYYIGSLLLWKGKKKNFHALACQPIFGLSQKDDPQQIVLDGQQRLAAVYYAFFAPNKPLPGRANRYRYFVRVDKFIKEEYEDSFIYDWKKGAEKIINDSNLQFQYHKLPLSVIGKEGSLGLYKWIQGYQNYWNDPIKPVVHTNDPKQWTDKAEQFCEYLTKMLSNYQVSYIELDQDLDIAKVCDIFTRVNSRGVRLDAFDLLNAMLRPKNLRLRDMWHKAAPKLDFVNTDRMNVYILQVMSIVLQAYCSPKYLYYMLPGTVKKVRAEDGSFKDEILVVDPSVFVEMWDKSVDAIEKAIGQLSDPREYGAISSQYMPYVSILPVFAALQVAVDSINPMQQLDAQNKIRLWYWTSVFMSRYSRSVESTAASDYMEVRHWINSGGDEPSSIVDFRSHFQSLSLRDSTRNSSIYKGIFNLIVRQGARDWITGRAPMHRDLDDHHIVPKSWGKDHGLAVAIDTILNRTPLTAHTNRNVVGEKLPNEYLPKLIEQNGEDLVRQTLESHFISSEAFDILLRVPFGVKDFEDFVVAREKAVRSNIKEMLLDT